MPAFITLLQRPLMRRAVIFLLMIAAITLFLINLRKSGEQVGRLTERLAAKDHAHETLQDMLDAAVRRPANTDALTQRLRDGKF
jgi:hypothetical protein